MKMWETIVLLEIIVCLYPLITEKTPNQTQKSNKRDDIISLYIAKEFNF